MLIERALAAALSLKSAYDDLRPDDPDAATKWRQIIDPIAADLAEARKTNKTPSAAVAEYLLSA